MTSVNAKHEALLDELRKDYTDPFSSASLIPTPRVAQPQPKALWTSKDTRARLME